MINIRNRYVLKRTWVMWLFVATPQLGLAQGTWQASADGQARKALELSLQSQQAKGFDQGKLVTSQSFINRETHSYLAGATIWNSRYPGVSKCVLVSNNLGSPVLLIPPEPDLDLPLSCTGEMAISFLKKGPSGSRALALFSYESPSQASIRYPLVLDIKSQQVVIDVAATNKVNKARDDGKKLQSIADLKIILNEERARK